MTQDDLIRVLIVDDDEAIREALSIAFEDQGYQVIEAPDGLIALEVLNAMPYPMVVLTNHNMPRLDGPGFMSFVLETPDLATRHAFIYMTAGNRVIDPKLAQQLQALSAPVVRKPFDLDKMLDAVADAAGRLPTAP